MGLAEGPKGPEIRLRRFHQLTSVAYGATSFPRKEANDQRLRSKPVQLKAKCPAPSHYPAIRQHFSHSDKIFIHNVMTA